MTVQKTLYSAYFFKNEDFPSNDFQSSRSFLPSQIPRNTETIITIITKKPAPKNTQISKSAIATPFRRKVGSRVAAHMRRLPQFLLYDSVESISIHLNPKNKIFPQDAR